MLQTYQWKPGSRISGVSAEVAGRRLAEIADENDGALTADLVVEDARPADAPLHRAFEWDDDIAAEAYRLVQARSLIRAVVVTNLVEDAPPTRAFVQVTSGTEWRGYMPTTTALSDAALRQQILARARLELAAWADRYRQLVELAELLDAMEERIAMLAAD